MIDDGKQNIRAIELMQHVGHNIKTHLRPDPDLDVEYLTLECKTCRQTMLEFVVGLSWDMS